MKLFLVQIFRCGYSLVFLAAVLGRGGGAGELPPLSPPDELRSLADEVDGPAVTWKSLFSLEIRNSSWGGGTSSGLEELTGPESL